MLRAGSAPSLERLNETNRKEVAVSRPAPQSAETQIPSARAGVSLFGVLIVVAALVTGCGGGGSSSSDSTGASTGATQPAPSTAPAAQIQVDLKEYTVTPSSAVGKAGTVTFAVTNSGTIAHELVVIQTKKPAGALLEGGKADETGNVGETGDLEAGAQKTLHLKLRPGHYALICNLPGHYVSGQHTDFNVQ